MLTASALLGSLQLRLVLPCGSVKGRCELMLGRLLHCCISLHHLCSELVCQLCPERLQGRGLLRFCCCRRRSQHFLCFKLRHLSCGRQCCGFLVRRLLSRSREGGFLSAFGSVQGLVHRDAARLVKRVKLLLGRSSRGD